MKGSVFIMQNVSLCPQPVPCIDFGNARFLHLRHSDVILGCLEVTSFMSCSEGRSLVCQAVFWHLDERLSPKWGWNGMPHAAYCSAVAHMTELCLVEAEHNTKRAADGIVEPAPTCSPCGSLNCCKVLMRASEACHTTQ